jgi:hypothetical protein
LIIISEARINIKIKKTSKIIITKIIPKVLKEIYIKTIEVFFRKEVIPKTFSNIALRDARSIIN